MNVRGSCNTSTPWAFPASISFATRMSIRRRVPSAVIIPMIPIVDYQSENVRLPKAIRLPRGM